MKKQLYKIERTDWLVTIKQGKSVNYDYYKTKAEAVKSVAGCPGQVQIFKLSYEFKDAYTNVAKTK